VGRYINCKIGNEYEIVWKYGFGVQDSEMYRIATELGIGEYHLIRYVDDENGKEDDFIIEYVLEDQTDVDGDVLILSRSDLGKLEEQIQALRKTNLTNSDEWFVAMLEAIQDFIVEHSEQERFIFEGEF
jgi:hypothetical protein